MSLDSILRATEKNLFDINSVTGFVNSSGNIMSENNMKIQNSSIIANYGMYGQSCMTKEYIHLPVGTYTISADVLINNTNANPVYIGLYELDKKINLNKATTIPLNQTTRVSATVNVVKNGNYHILTQGSGNVSQYINLNAVFSNIQVEEGSTATDYEPYHRILQSVKMPSNGENLTPYPYADNNKTENGISFVTGYYSGIRINGTVSSDLPVSFIIVDNLDLTAGNYTFSSGYNGTIMPNDVIVQLYYLENTIPKGVSTLSGSKLQETFSIDDTLAQKKFRAVIALNTEMSDSFSVDDLLLCPTLVKSGSKEVLKVSYNSRNFFNINNVYSPLNTDTYEISNNTLKVYRNRVSVVGVFYHIPLPIGTQYTLYYDIEYGGTATGIYNCADSKIFNGSLNHVNYTGTVGDTGYLKLEFSRMGGDNDKLGWVIYSNIQLELGNKKTDYVPYFNTVVWEKQEIVATNKLGSFKLGESVLA